MLVSLVRAVIIYVLIFFCMRLMGKRQLGELQPTELIITILISAIVAIPMQENSLPLGNSILAVLLLVALEIINSAIGLKSPKWRSFCEGNSIAVIHDGKIDQKQLKRLRISADDILEQLREKDVFDINDVEYAIVETNGKLSVMKKSDGNKAIMLMIINDGKIIKNAAEKCKMTDKKINNILKQNRIAQNEVFLMLADKNGKCTIIRKEE